MNIERTASLSRKLWQIYLPVGFVGLLVVVTLWYAMSTGSRVAKQYYPLADAAMEIKLEVTTAHLWFEEIVGGDQHEDISVVWHHIDQAEWYAQAMLEGGQNDKGTYIPLDDPILQQKIQKVLEKIKVFRAIAQERIVDSGKSYIGSDIDQHFDAIFRDFLKQVDDVETALQQIMKKDTERFRFVQSALLALCLIITGIVGAVLFRFERRQSSNLAMLRAANQQLVANEQQLKAANQQLRAGDQQLKATNQQLMAGEQQLKAANQQLRAGDQQLKATNQQLRASEQQLKAANKQLRQSQQKLSLHVQQTPLGVIQWDLDFKVTEWNSAAENIFGFTSEEAIGQHAAGLIVPPSAKEAVDQVWRDLLTQRGGTRSTNENVTKRNGTILCEWYNTPLIDENGEVIGVASLVLDITERKRVDEALRKSKETAENYLNICSEIIVTLDAEGTITMLNESGHSIFEYDKGDLIGKNWFDTCMPRKMQDEVRTVFEKLMRGEVEEVMTYENPIVTKNGSEKIILWHNTLLRDESGNICGSLSSGEDITEIKRLQTLESRAERLETAGTIAGQVAHDFNNLLAPLIAYPDFIRDELPKSHPTLQYLDQIEKAAQKIADINQDLLTMGRRGHYNQVVLNLNTVIQHAYSELEPLPKTLVCELDLSENLMDILGGGAQLHRMVSNMLHNAKDAMQDIGQIIVRTENYYVDDVSIVYGRVPKGEYVKLTISDTGCGIPDDIVQKIFDPFFTTKATDKKRGSGLGMSVVDAVVKDHNGFIDLSTKVGKGTSFYIYFPITREAMDSQDLDETCGGSEMVLVVDDDITQCEVSSQLLKKQGYKVHFVESGEKAIEYLRENRRDLVLLDMVMPGGIDGTETYRRILEISPHQKAIILSGFSESDRVLEAQKLGAGAFVRKPVSMKVIACTVRAELDRRRDHPST